VSVPGEGHEDVRADEQKDGPHVCVEFSRRVMQVGCV
jgi:hypothetical protein